MYFQTFCFEGPKSIPEAGLQCLPEPTEHHSSVPVPSQPSSPDMLSMSSPNTSSTAESAYSLDQSGFLTSPAPELHSLGMYATPRRSLEYQPPFTSTPKSTETCDVLSTPDQSQPSVSVSSIQPFQTPSGLSSPEPLQHLSNTPEQVKHTQTPVTSTPVPNKSCLNDVKSPPSDKSISSHANHRTPMKDLINTSRLNYINDSDVNHSQQFYSTLRSGKHPIPPDVAEV
ncbi:uncharacterized protein [Amphiura filiformis]|uniref:uncharacterized protein n=1 Tax=Amphiura filiformis TaxID=82378 RepID=UPI003B21570C